MTVRWRIVLFEIIALAFIAAMVAVTALGLQLAGEFVRRVDGVHNRFEAIAELDGHANNYAEQIAEVLLLGDEQMDEFNAARAEMQAAFERLDAVTRAEVATMRGVDEVRRELDDIALTARMIQLYEAIERAADLVFELQSSGRRAEAIDIFRRDVEYRLSSEFEQLIETALQDERNEVARELDAVRQQRIRLIVAASLLALLAVACGVALGPYLHRSIVRPVQALAHGARALASGNLSHRIAWRGSDEFAELSRTFDDMAAAMEEGRARLVGAQERLETEVAARTAELTAANARLRRLDDRRTQFLADVSHQIRTPLTIMRGEADVALRLGPGEEQERALRHVRSHARDLGLLIDDLMAFAHAEADDGQFHPEPMALADLLGPALRDGAVLAAARELTLETAIHAPATVVVADPRSLRQALVIGLDNAVTHSRPGGAIAVTTADDGDTLSVAIADAGPGVATEDRPFVFDRFFRGRTAPERPGFGIGLAIAKEIVDRHGGAIALDNLPGSGAVLRITLPLAAREVP